MVAYLDGPLKKKVFMSPSSLFLVTVLRGRNVRSFSPTRDGSNSGKICTAICTTLLIFKDMASVLYSQWERKIIDLNSVVTGTESLVTGKCGVLTGVCGEAITSWLYAHSYVRRTQ